MELWHQQFIHQIAESQARKFYAMAIEPRPYNFEVSPFTRTVMAYGGCREDVEAKLRIKRYYPEGRKQAEDIIAEYNAAFISAWDACHAKFLANGWGLELPDTGYYAPVPYSLADKPVKEWED